MGTIYTFQNETDLDTIADADKLLIYDASTGLTKSATALDLQNYISGGLQSAGSALTLTQAAHAGKTIVLDTAAGSTVTLPAASGSGMLFRFIVSVLATSNSHIVKVANASDTMKGLVFTVSDNTNAVLGWIAAATDDTITLNRSTTGSVSRGEYIEVQDVAANVWAVRGFTASTGTEATPFSATVS